MQKYYPWLVAAVACLGMMLSNGLIVTGLPVYDEAILAEFDWDRGSLKFRDMLTFAFTACIAPFAGALIDRFGVRICMVFGWLLLALGYAWYAHLASLGELYLIHVLFAVVLVLCALNPSVILVSTWFNRHRGTAIGIALIGTSIGGTLMPQYGTAVSAAVGWRDAMLYAASFPLLMIVLVALVLRNRPEQLGLQPLGGSAVVAGTAETDNQSVSRDLSFQEALRSRSFWALAVIAMCTFYTVLGIQAHLFLYLRDSATDAQTATNAISLFFLLAVVGKLVFGMIADRVDNQRVMVANILVMLVGSALLVSMSVSLVWPAIILLGLGWGGLYTMIQLSAINCFGTSSAGKILGMITVLDAFGGGLGIWLTGVFFELTGGYQLAFAIFTALLLVAFASIRFIELPGRAPRPVEEYVPQRASVS